MGFVVPYKYRLPSTLTVKCRGSIIEMCNLGAVYYGRIVALVNADGSVKIHTVALYEIPGDITPFHFRSIEAHQP